MQDLCISTKEVRKVKSSYFLEEVTGHGFLFFNWEPVRELPAFNFVENKRYKHSNHLSLP